MIDQTTALWNAFYKVLDSFEEGAIAQKWREDFEEWSNYYGE